MTTSPLTKKIGSTYLLRDGPFVVADKFGDVVKVLDIIPPISLGAIPSLLDKVLYNMASTFLNYLFIKKAVNLKGFNCVSIALNKNRRRMLRP